MMKRLVIRLHLIPALQFELCHPLKNNAFTSKRACVCACVRVYVCVCVLQRERERGGGEGRGERERKPDRAIDRKKIDRQIDRSR